MKYKTSVLLKRLASITKKSLKVGDNYYLKRFLPYMDNYGELFHSLCIITILDSDEVEKLGERFRGNYGVYRINFEKLQQVEKEITDLKTEWVVFENEQEPIPSYQPRLFS
jgi:hypothetical protein